MTVAYPMEVWNGLTYFLVWPLPKTATEPFRPTYIYGFETFQGSYIGLL